MNRTRNRFSRTAAALALAAVLVGGCSRGLSSLAPGSDPGRPTGTCPGVLNKARQAVARAEDSDAWDGPTSGPRAVRGKSIVFVAETMTNPGVAGAAKAVEDAGRSIGWNVRVIDGQGTPAGARTAFGQAIALRPSGIVIGGFDPNSTAEQVRQADDAHIPLIGWHATSRPGPSQNPKLFTNVTTRVEDVARISAYWIIAQSNGNAGVVIFTDSSIPFAENKSQLIKKTLQTCSSVKLLSYQNIPLPDTGSRTPQAVSALVSRFGDRWTYSAAINDLYFADAAPALRAAGKAGGGAPFSIGAGDGDPSAFQRVRDRQFQAATVPEPLNAQGSQIVDEFNRAFAGQPPSGYVAPVHLTTTQNVDDTTSWDPRGFRAAYERIWNG
ncbi:substrate-binding domain-containing protein [Nonomuraea sp. NEAU-A123]|uniref:substrate-binding domain-containing protein n=1 Tax=Nonomuraea sp. NEAU-A123 TaxID=2839649 RepID=UPI001BE3D956|nr:substrate-binding domain-containing protein [Nonomuraea sp. NEAU-A123]MBT2226745.1 substrate-binding domain-containing protein [Nonomuraea sp. NEAU-A123]